jgi:hypothetical protein
VAAVPKPIQTRLAYALKQDMRKGAVHGQQIINIQTQLAALSAAAAAAPPAGAAPSSYTAAWGAEVVAAINALIAALQ